MTYATRVMYHTFSPGPLQPLISSQHRTKMLIFGNTIYFSAKSDHKQCPVKGNTEYSFKTSKADLVQIFSYTNTLFTMDFHDQFTAISVIKRNWQRFRQSDNCR